MAARSKGRKGPRRTRNWVYTQGRWKKICYFDGYEMRQMLPVLDTLLWRGDGSPVSEALPSDEIWIDARYEAELAFLMKVYGIETMRRWKKKDAHGRYPPYAQLRAYLKKELCLPGPVPPFVERSEWDAKNHLTIQYVRGDIVRRYFDPHFMLGGHDLVYGSYITTPRTVWIDVRQDPREIPFTLMHEIAERCKMEKGWTYDQAHEHANAVEMQSRARKHLVHPVRKERHGKAGALPMILFGQEGDPACGPACLRMMFGHFKRTYRGKPYTEKKLVELCRCDDEGTEHADLIAGAKAAGASVFAKENGTIDELRYFVHKERLPVLVGWWNGPEQPVVAVQRDHDLDEGHFSVVINVTRTHVWLADPWIIDPRDENKGGPGIRKVPIRQFMRHASGTRPEFSWCDIDTEAYLPSDRWYMVLNFEGRRFRLPGGANY